VQPSHAQNDWNAVLEEVWRTIDRWFFWVSVTGVIYVTPRNRWPDRHDLADMIRRLTIICDESFPALIAFEFPDSFVESDHWDDARAMIDQFATEIDASISLVSEGRPAGTLLMLHRSIRRPDMVLQKTKPLPEDPMAA
jgi:hypothetical protein